MPTTSVSLRGPVVVFLAGVTAALHIGKIPPAMAQLGETLGMSLVQAGFLLSTVQLAGMLFGAVAGALTDAAGLRRSMLAGLLMLCVASVLGAWARGPSELLALRMLEGAGTLCVILPAPSLMRRLVPAERLPWFLGLWGAYMPGGVALSLWVGPLVLDLADWRVWWWGLGGLAAVAAIALALTVREPKSLAALGAQPPARAVRVRGEERSVLVQGVARRLHQTLTHAGPWVVAVAFAMYSSQWLAVIGFLPTVYAQAGVSGTAAGGLTALACLANVVGNLGGGALLRRGCSRSGLLWWGFVGMAPATVIAFSPLVGEAALLRYGAVVAFSAVGGMIPVTLFALAVHVAPSDETVATTIGWMQQFSSLGQFMGPPAVAWLAAATGTWAWTWTLAAVTSLIGLVLAAWVRRHVPG